MMKERWKNFYAPAGIWTHDPPGQSTNRFFINLLLQIGIILTAYEVNLNHQYLFIFSVDFHVFGHCSISIPHRSRKDPLYALAYFLVYFGWFSAMWITKKGHKWKTKVSKELQKWNIIYEDFKNAKIIKVGAT